MKKTGFTLVELLVVITIIAILAAVGLTVYKGAEKQGRIAKRVEDLKAIQTALELYYANNKSYPVVTLGTNTGWRSECQSWGTKASNDVVPTSTNFVPNYMVAFPSDPQMDTANSRSCYLYTSDGYNYKVLVHDVAEFKDSDWVSQPNLIDPNRDSGSNGCIVDLPDNDGTDRDIWSWAVWSSSTSACW
ncbi:prepilin-type N-terminal cleavage/methylation domain-containing protein [Candidatus Daviesbacteria bacterium]|nr:prepilin-type N-terminal cleavage/methylation domain-containing protein [Candidatus Daviesbacteria bacterium]